MITWFARAASTWWHAAVATATETMDEIDAVWEPFLTDDDLTPADVVPAG